MVSVLTGFDIASFADALGWQLDVGGSCKREDVLSDVLADLPKRSTNTHQQRS